MAVRSFLRECEQRAFELEVEHRGGTTYQLWNQVNAEYIPYPLVKINSMQATAMYNYYREYIKPFIDFEKLKHKISTADRKARCIEYDRIQARREYAIEQTA